jgi:hypothetical protein
VISPTPTRKLSVYKDYVTISGSLAIGQETITNNNILLEMSSSNKGVVFPTVLGSARASMSGVVGLIVYQTDNSGSSADGLYIYKSTGWVQII